MKSLSGTAANAEKPQRDITILIAPDGKVSGCAGVNRYFGTAKVDGAAKTIDFKSNPMGATKMAGPGMAYEDAFFKMLNSVDSFIVRDGRLILKSADKPVAEFQN